MASPFNKNPASSPSTDPYARERIEREIEHLRKGKSVRRADGKNGGVRGAWFLILLAGLVLVLFLMDPVLHAYRREQAISNYLYLHHFGSDEKAGKLLSTGIFMPAEIELLNRRQGNFMSYYSSPQQADQVADAIIGYFEGVSLLQAGTYDRLDMVGKIRYELFVRWGIKPPVSWSVLDPSIGN